MNKIIYIAPEFEAAIKTIPKDISRELDLSTDIALRILEIIENRKMSQADFAKAMGKKESEISKWLGGGHNFTISTIARIEAVLGEDILSVKRYRKPVSGYNQMSEAKRRYLSEKRQEKYGKGKK